MVTRKPRLRRMRAQYASRSSGRFCIIDHILDGARDEGSGFIFVLRLIGEGVEGRRRGHADARGYTGASLRQAVLQGSAQPVQDYLATFRWATKWFAFV